MTVVVVVLVMIIDDSTSSKKSESLPNVEEEIYTCSRATVITSDNGVNSGS